MPQRKKNNKKKQQYFVRGAILNEFKEYYIILVLIKLSH